MNGAMVTTGCIAGMESRTESILSPPSVNCVQLALLEITSQLSSHMALKSLRLNTTSSEFQGPSCVWSSSPLVCLSSGPSCRLQVSHPSRVALRVQVPPVCFAEFQNPLIVSSRSPRPLVCFSNPCFCHEAPRVFGSPRVEFPPLVQSHRVFAGVTPVCLQSLSLPPMCLQVPSPVCLAKPVSRFSPSMCLTVSPVSSSARVFAEFGPPRVFVRVSSPPCVCRFTLPPDVFAEFQSTCVFEFAHV
ncbi:hypothetical protein AVEN_189268-1 [Araneus ventricosus]|uniref:Uncharacterized protein n=1 Tax=Araneus ventricosus TaxID=182803 RepID=A0A4Y2LSR7_ARAVE|nr:hypothetical protein AVEN_189268-1 [Araneus ventricosus]